MSRRKEGNEGVAWAMGEIGAVRVVGRVETIEESKMS